MAKQWWTGNYGIELLMTLEQAESGSHSGQCDSDIDALSRVPEISAQLEKLDSESLRLKLKEYGAWDSDELSDHNQNLQRILWIACNDIKERQYMEPEELEEYEED
jgi:hypothetical protein